jgi:anti-sigma factor RsiW
MVNCQQSETQITPYVDEVLEVPAREALEAHLAACPACRASADAERQARTWLRGHAAELRVPPPPGLEARLRAVGGVVAAPRAPRWPAWPVAATLLVGLIGTGLWVLGTQNRALASELRADHERCFTFEPARAAVEHAVVVDGETIDVPLGSQAHALDLRAVRRCRVAGEPMAHALYRSHGEPVSLFVATGRRAGAVRAIMGYEVRAWDDERRTYALVGHLAAERMDDLARFLGARAVAAPR